MITLVPSALSLAAIIAGGVISAFTARHPTRPTSWVSAYLVLVVGVIQLGLVVAWQQLGHLETALAACAFISYNLGNIGVIVGTLLKQRARYYCVLVDIGGALLALAMILLLLAIRGLSTSPPLIGFISLVVIILVSMPIGLMLSHRRRT